MKGNPIADVREPKAMLLAKVYKLILSLSEPVSSENNETIIDEVSLSADSSGIDDVQADELEK